MSKHLCNLKDCFLCKHSLPEWKELINIKKTTIIIKKGKSIFKENDLVQGIYFIYSGLTKVHMKWGEQKELIIRFVKEGDILGIRGIGNNHLYPVSATALTDVKVCFITNDFLDTVLISNPKFTYYLLQIYANDLHLAEKRMRNLVHMEVKSRLAEALLELSSLLKNDSNNELHITLNRQDIASYVGTTYETLFKFFAELTKKRIISISGKTIYIRHPKKLQTFITKPII